MTYLLVVLAVYRAAHMAALEDGPFDVFASLRERVGQATWIGRGLHCVLCVSFWLALVAIGWLPGDWLLDWLAVAGAVMVLHLVLYRSSMG